MTYAPYAAERLQVFPTGVLKMNVWAVFQMSIVSRQLSIRHYDLVTALSFCTIESLVGRLQEGFRA